MMYILLLATFTLISKSEIQPNARDGTFDSTCKDICTDRRCNIEWAYGANANGEHPCSTYSAPLGKDYSVDPWMESQLIDPACQETICATCGTQVECVQKCTAFKAAHGLGGDDYPKSCATACNEVVNEDGLDWKCWMPADPGYTLPTDFSKPECFPYFECTGQYIAANGKQPCSARNYLVNPWNCDMSAFHADNVGEWKDCALLNGDNKCGNQDECVAECTEWNDRVYGKTPQTQVNCVQECAAVDGWKCFVGCRNTLAEEDIFAMDLNVNSYGKYGKSYIWGVFMLFISLIIFGAYRYRTTKENKLLNTEETDVLIHNDYGSLNA